MTSLAGHLLWRRGIPVLVSVALLAVAAPSSGDEDADALATVAARSSGTRPHHVLTSKAEAWTDVAGHGTRSVDVSCPAGSVAVDGSWWVDAVDDVNPGAGILYGDERDVVVDASYADATDAAGWHFRLHNDADGRAQLKLFVECLAGETDVNASHQHRVVVSAPTTVERTLPGMGSGTGGTGTVAGACGADQVPVAPGFQVLSGAARLTASSVTADGSGWSWGFAAPRSGSTGAVAVRLHVRCLDLLLAAAGPVPVHTHRIGAAEWPSAGATAELAAGPTAEVDLSCPDGRESLVGGFAIADTGRQWYLGQDPRSSARAFRYWSTDGSTAVVGAHSLCVRHLTGKQIKPPSNR